MTRFLFFLLLVLQSLQIAAQQLPELIPYRDGKLWGYADSTGKVWIKPQYEQTNFFVGNYALADDTGGTGVINRKGQWIIAPNYKEIIHNEDYNFTVLDWSEKQGLCDTLGRFLLPCNYTKIKWFTTESKMHFYELQSTDTSIRQVYFLSQKKIIPGISNCYEVENSGLLIGFNSKNRKALFSREGVALIPFDSIQSISERMVAYVPKGEWKKDTVVYIITTDFKGRERLYDLNGKALLPGAYESIEISRPGYFRCETSPGKYLPVMTAGGALAVPEPWDWSDIQTHNSNIVIARRQSANYATYNLYSLSGKRLILPETESYEGIKRLNDNLYIVYKNKQNLLADTNGFVKWWPHKHIFIKDVLLEEDTFIYGNHDMMVGLYGPGGHSIVEFKGENFYWLGSKLIFIVETKNHTRYQMIRADGKALVTGKKIYLIDEKNPAYFMVEAKRSGICTSTGEWALSCIYNGITHLFGPYYAVKYDFSEKWAFYDLYQRKFVSDFVFEWFTVVYLSDSRRPFYLAKKAGMPQLFTTSGRTITLPASHKLLMESSAGNALFGIGDYASSYSTSNWQFYDTTGKVYPHIAEILPEDIRNRTRPGRVQVEADLSSLGFFPLYPAMDTLAAQGFKQVIPVYRKQQQLAKMEMRIRSFKTPESAISPGWYLLKKTMNNVLYSGLADSTGHVLLDSLDDIQELVHSYFLVSRNQKMQLYDASRKQFVLEPAVHISLSMAGNRAGETLFSYSSDGKNMQLINAAGIIYATAAKTFDPVKSNIRLFFVEGQRPYYVDDKGRVYASGKNE